MNGSVEEAAHEKTGLSHWETHQQVKSKHVQMYIPPHLSELLSKLSRMLSVIFCAILLTTFILFIGLDGSRPHDH